MNDDAMGDGRRAMGDGRRAMIAELIRARTANRGHDASARCVIDDDDDDDDDDEDDRWSAPHGAATDWWTGDAIDIDIGRDSATRRRRRRRGGGDAWGA